MEETCQSVTVGGGDSEQCGGEIIYVNEKILTPPFEPINFSEEYNEIEGPSNPEVKSQTARMFKYIVGLLEDPNDHGPNLRIVKLLTQSFQILSRFCDHRFVPEEFSSDVEKAFLFLVRESESYKIKDVSISEYEKIKEALDDCLEHTVPFKFEGTVCRSETKVCYKINLMI